MTFLKPVIRGFGRFEDAVASLALAGIVVLLPAEILARAFDTSVPGALPIVQHLTLWLGFLGEQEPPLEQLWRLYLRRFSIEHWYRFIKQRLHWTLPRFSRPAQHDRWSDLMPVMTMQLYLARGAMLDHVLPWQKPQLAM